MSVSALEFKRVIAHTSVESYHRQVAQRAKGIVNIDQEPVSKQFVASGVDGGAVREATEETKAAGRAGDTATASAASAAASAKKPWWAKAQEAQEEAQRAQAASGGGEEDSGGEGGDGGGGVNPFGRLGRYGSSKEVTGQQIADACVVSVVSVVVEEDACEEEVANGAAGGWMGAVPSAGDAGWVEEEDEDCGGGGGGGGSGSAPNPFARLGRFGSSKGMTGTEIAQVCLEMPDECDFSL